MAKSAMIRARVEPDLKAETAGGLPFEVRTPNQTTCQTLQKTDEGQELVRCQDAMEMFDRLGL